ncbi:AsmA family protein [Thalassospiraceae bacterium LMO-SO8]|nr:AsmA family protein [Alphaproteobacteria bacterium LMO-S08]WND75921.1 AsmA family protein [Thalassospiraceae bacterium LMO-SO8]
MKRLFKTISILGVLLIAVVVAAVAVLSSLDFNDYKGVIAEEAKKATGRDLKISGDLKLNISLTPSLYVDGVTFANAPWGSRPDMVTLKRLEAEVALLPLLSSKVDVKRVVLIGLDLLAETDKQGRGNWQFGAADGKSAAPAEESSGGGNLPLVRKVHIKDLRVTYRDGRTGEQTRLTLPSLDLGADGIEAPLRVALKGDVNGEDFSAAGTIASIRQLTAGGEMPLDLKAQALGADMTVRGAIADPRAMTGLALTLSIKGDSLSETLATAAKLAPQLASLKVPDLGPYDVSLTVTGSSTKPSVSNLKASLGRPGETALTAAGSIADAIKAQGIDLQIAATVQDPAGLAKDLGAEAPPLPAVTASARVTDKDGGYRLQDVDVKIGASDLKGTAALNLGGARPKVSADLQSTLLDLDELLPKGDGKPAPPAADGRLFPADPLPLDGLKAVDADINLAATRLRVNKMDVTGLRLGVLLQGGRLTVKPMQATVADGVISGEITLGADQAVPPLAVNLNVAKLDYGKLAAAMGQKSVAEGTADVTLKVTGAGTSVRQIMAGLDGKLRVVSEKGHIDSTLLNVASADILSAIPLIDSKGDKDLRCAVVDFDVVKGIANAKALVLETGGLSVVGVGGINLRDETLNLVLEPRAKKTSLLSATIVPVAVRGTLAKPEPKVNPADLVTGMASNVASGAAAIMTFGLSALAQSAFNRATSTDDTDYCAQALAGKQVAPSKGAAKPAPAQQQPQEKPKSGGGALQNLEKGLGGLKGLLGK